MSKQFEIRIANPGNTDWLMERDHSLAMIPEPGQMLAHLMARCDILIAEKTDVRAGFLRLERIWLRLPYIGLIRIDQKYRKAGIGRAFLAFLKEREGKAGHATIWSSSQADEPAPQAWHRHMGFREAGFIAGMNDGDIGEIFFRLDL